jgi:hypothetical protein
MRRGDMANQELILLAVGDLIFEETDSEMLLEPTFRVLKSADVLIGQGEITYSSRPVSTLTDRVPAPRDPEEMKGLKTAGFKVITLAGNHVWDLGKPGLEDTLSWFREHNIAACGAGLNLEEARRPAILERRSVRFGVLSYNCVGPKETWAAKDKSGCAYVNIITHYELDHATPGGTPTAYTAIELDSLEMMQEDIRRLRSQCEVLVVSFHKGIVHTPILVSKYERHLSFAAIDAGADLILGHHAHILHGIELYKGKAIFHSLGNYAVSLRMAVDPSLGPQQWALRRKKLFGFEPDPEYPTYPFHPEAVHTLIAKCQIQDGKIGRISYLPCLVNKKGQPEILPNNARGQATFNYIARITQEAGLNAQYHWEGNEVIIQ